jgi:ssDNA-binding Zn-finger/Zn-ribbon topoisomerase 1
MFSTLRNLLRPRRPEDGYRRLANDLYVPTTYVNQPSSLQQSQTCDETTVSGKTATVRKIAGIANSKELQKMLKDGKNCGFLIVMKDGRTGFTHVHPCADMDPYIDCIKIGEWPAGKSLIGQFVPYKIDNPYYSFETGKPSPNETLNRELKFYRFPVNAETIKPLKFNIRSSSSDGVLATPCPDCRKCAVDCLCPSVFFPYYGLNLLEILPPL